MTVTTEWPASWAPAGRIKAKAEGETGSVLALSSSRGRNPRADVASIGRGIGIIIVVVVLDVVLTHLLLAVCSPLCTPSAAAHFLPALVVLALGFQRSDNHLIVILIVVDGIGGGECSSRCVVIDGWKILSQSRCDTADERPARQKHKGQAHPGVPTASLMA